MDDPATETLELDLLQQAILARYGYDFTNYSQASFKRRVMGFMVKVGLEHISELLPRILHREKFFHEFLAAITVTVTEMFRDPDVYQALREQVVPILRTYPSLNIWHAGCSTGEEVYSLAILLAEEGLLERTQIYATDINTKVLQTAREGIYSIDQIREYTANYQQAGGQASFSDYYHAEYGAVIMAQSLRENILFTDHNLVSDGPFGSMHLVFCRNVLIYFNEQLQERVLNLFADSLLPRGFLCLGSRESLRSLNDRMRFRVIDPGQKLFQLKE